MKKVKVILSPEAEEAYNYLLSNSSKSKIDKSILNSINKKIELIKMNYHYGNPIAKELIPKEFKDKYEISNLFRVELSNFWRMLYSIVDGDDTVEIISFILSISDHEDYNKMFGYKKK